MQAVAIDEYVTRRAGRRDDHLSAVVVRMRTSPDGLVGMTEHLDLEDLLIAATVCDDT